MRAPFQELAQAVIDWLNRFGIPATQVMPLLENLPEQRVLVDLLPASSASPWPGPRIVCAPAGGTGSDPLNQTWDVDLFDLRAIAHAVSFAQQGKQLSPRHASTQCTEDLGLHILTAEDNPINQAILKEQLEALGCTTLVVSNGEQAIDHWRPGMFDLVLTDINMPVMNGYELARVLRKLDPGLPIIGVTANAMREEGMRCIAVGMNAWVVKPLSIQTLRSHLTKLCRPSLQTSAHRIEAEALTAPMDDTGFHHVQLTPAMRELFTRTMQQDMALASNALEHGDGAQLAQTLHRIGGGLAAVQASHLAQCCNGLEIRLADTPLDAALGVSVQEVLVQLSSLLGSLE